MASSLHQRKPPLTFFFFFFFFFFFSSSSLLNYPCKPPHFNSFPFCNTSLPVPARARSLVSLLSLPQKIHQLSNTAAAVPSLGIPPYEWWSESLHGLAANGPGVRFLPPVPAATLFPQVIVSSASFNRPLWRALARAIAAEARAMHNEGRAGLTFWAPNVNVFRDPRWGRGQETPGEDPTAAAAYAADYVSAFQRRSGWRFGESGLAGGGKRVLGEDDGDGGLMMLSACCKHHAAYDLEKWGEFSRYTFDAKVWLVIFV